VVSADVFTGVSSLFPLSDPVELHEAILVRMTQIARKRVKEYFIIF
jgi:hypothetical protein